MLMKNLLVKCKQRKNYSFHRYYVKNIDSIEIIKKKDTIIKKTNEKEALKQDDEVNESIASCARTWKRSKSAEPKNLMNN